MKLQTMLVLGCLAVGTSAQAEQNEMMVGLTGGVLMPSFESQSPLAPALATWGLGIVGQYGLTDNFYVTGAFLWSSFSGRLTDHMVQNDGRAYSGVYSFNSSYYHPEIGLRYKLYAGYNLAPGVIHDPVAARRVAAHAASSSS